MEKLIAFCGLDCKKCDSYVATVSDDNELREKTAKYWSQLNHVQITPEMINCLGCKQEGIKTVYCSHMCQIRKCAIESGFETCGECPKLAQCETVGIIIKNNPDALNNLKK